MTAFSELKAKEVLVGALVLLLLFSLANPFNLYMLSMGGMVALALLVVAFLMYSAAVWGELREGDERDALHQALVGRVAYLFGTLGLLAAIVFESLRHTLDPLLIYVLALMILVKIIGTAYVRSHY